MATLFCQHVTPGCVSTFFERNIFVQNFNKFLVRNNEQRINEVCKRLVDTVNNGNKTNEAIAEEVGFKSRSHFIRTFKKITGLTPSQYQRMAKLEIED